MLSKHQSRFSRPEVLASIRPELLRRFLTPYQSYFHGGGFDMECLNHRAGPVELTHLSDILLTPVVNIPPEVANALYAVHEVAVEENTELLEMLASSEQVPLEPDSTLLELALSLWMTAPKALKWIHQHQSCERKRAFEYFSTAGDALSDFSLSAEGIRQLEQSLSYYFKKKDWGHGCRINHRPQSNEHWFLVSHGERYKRQATWEEGRMGTIGFRPERYDLIIYDALTEELCVNAQTPTQREHYRKLFGFYLFGRENYFPGRSKYTLEPLLRDGATALFTGDIPEIESVRLSELSYVIDGNYEEVITHKAYDVFASMKQHREYIPPGARLLKATFKLRYTAQPKERTLTLKPSNVALYTRDGDGPILEKWLHRREFVVRDRVKGHEQSEHVLAVG
jgi:hypothetical protein